MNTTQKNLEDREEQKQQLLPLPFPLQFLLHSLFYPHFQLLV
jgi:hypothetical protein